MFNLSTCSYNVHVAQKLGIYSAVFISLLDNQLMCAENIVGEDNLIKLDCSYIYNKTGISKEKLEEIENQLKHLNIIDFKNTKNNNGKYYKFNYSVLSDVLDFDDPFDNVGILSKTTSLFPQIKKKEEKRSSLKNCVEFKDELARAYMYDWIDLISQKYALSTASIKLAIQDLVNYAKDDYTIICEIIKIAIKCTYRNMSWAIDAYEKDIKKYTNNNFVEYNEIKSDGSEIVQEKF